MASSELNIGIVGNKYIQAMNSKFRYILSTGGTRSGKTYEAMQLFHIKATRSKVPLVFIVAGLTVPLTKKNLIAPFKIMAGIKVWNSDTYNKQDGTLTYPNGSVIYFMSHGEHNAEDKYTGIEADYALFDELNLSPEADGVLTQTGMRLKSGSIIVTQNPTRRRQWLTDLEKNPKCTTILSTYKDNLENLTQELIEELEYRGSVDARFKAVYLEGRYMANAELAVFPNFNVVNTWPTNVKWTAFGQDYGWTHPTTLVEVSMYDEQLWIRCHLYGSQLKDEVVIEANKKAGRNIIYADSASPDRINRYAKTANVVGIKKYTNQKEEISIAMKQYPINLYYDSPELVQEFEDGQWKKIGSEITDKLKDADDHIRDAVIYAVTDKLRTSSGNYSYR